MKLSPTGWLKFNLAAHQATKGRPVGERHLVGVVESGCHGLALATVALVVVEEKELPWKLNDPERLTFETFPEARAFVSAWCWYRIVRQEA
jgi:hypothetical protein